LNNINYNNNYNNNNNNNIMNKFSKILTEDISKGAARAMLFASGITRHNFPHIGIGAMAYDGNPCNMHTGKLSRLVQDSVTQRSMYGLVYSTIGISDGITMGSEGMRYSLPSRELIADSIESISNGHYYDGNIIIPSCDKNLPGAIMGVSRTNKPSLIIYGGSMMPGKYKCKDVDVVTAFQSYGELLNGKIDEKERDNLLTKCCPGAGSCGGMYTANTLACAIEAMGMSLPYSSSNPAISREKELECYNAGETMYNLLKNDIKPSDIITRKSLENAIKCIISLGGSTNAVIHLIAIARTLNIDLKLYDFNVLGSDVPVIANLKPHGKYLMYDVHKNGGTPVLLKYLLEQGYLYGDCMTVTGKTLAENLENVSTKLDTEIFQINNPIKKSSHINILYGSLSPEGCVSKITGNEGTFFRGTCKVYNKEEDFLTDLKDGKVLENTVVIIRYQGPKGSPGMPEMLKATSAIVGYGIKDKIAFITDGRFSGGSHGFIIGHVTPEAYEGGPIALVQDGDMVSICTITNSIELYIDKDEYKKRLDQWSVPEYVENNVNKSSYLAKYRKLVQPTYNGCML
jgi:dihydroxy-acid dehydratase